MSKLFKRVEMSLRSFYVFNSEFALKEGEEHKKIIYYHPHDIELNTKIKDVGLSEAIITFTGNFSKGCKALHTKKTTQLFYEAEPNYWLVMVINVPREIENASGASGDENTNYRGEEVHDRIYRAVLEQCYNTFRLFLGTFHSNLQELTQKSQSSEQTENVVKQFQQRMKQYFDKYIANLKLPCCDIFDIMKSVQYLPLKKSLFLRSHNFMNLLKANFNCISEAIFLYNEQIVCSGNLHPLDLYTIHEYLISHVFKTNNANANADNATAYKEALSKGYFVVPELVYADDSSNDEHCINTETKKLALKINLQSYGSKDDESGLHSYSMLIYRAFGSCTLCLFIKDYEMTTSDFSQELCNFIDPLLPIVRDIEDANKETTSSRLPHSAADSSDKSNNQPTKYIFLNEKNLKHLTNIAPHERRRCKSSTANNCIPANIMHIIADIGNRDELHSQLSSHSEESIVKSTDDYWVVYTRHNWRQYYIIINRKSTLLDVSIEAKSIFEQELKDDVFFDK